MSNEITQSGLTIGEAMKFAHLGDIIMREGDPKGTVNYFASESLKRLFEMSQDSATKSTISLLGNSIYPADMIATDWMAVTTVRSV